MRFNLHSLHFEQEQTGTNKLAFAGSNGDVSWSDFRKEVDRFRKIIKDANIVKDSPVIVYGHKEVQMPAAIAALLMEGHPYIPADVVMPMDRIAYMAQSAGAMLTINCSAQAIEPVTPVTFQQNQLQVSQQKHSAAPQQFDEKVAYMIFTSGSTGTPKGVVIPLSALHPFTTWIQTDFLVSENTVFMNQAPFSFDLSLVELYGTLTTGCSCILNSYDIVKQPDAFMQRLKKYGCNYWHSTPSFAFSQITIPQFSEAYLSDIKTFVFIGEELTSRVLSKIRGKFPSARFFNAYGPSEATYATTLVCIDTQIEKEFASSLPIGYACPHSEITLDNMTETEGEIVIHGPHVSLGYLNRPDLNETKFGINKKGGRFFRTGDYGYKKDDLLFFNGRKDEQVKLNGYRIEINEINFCLEKHTKVIEAITVPLKAGAQVKRIISFVKHEDASPFDANELKSFLADQLPAYMVPSEIIRVKDFPYSSNHKIDKNQLITAYSNGEFQ